MAWISRELRDGTLLTAVALSLGIACGSSDTDLFSADRAGRGGASDTGGAAGLPVNVGGAPRGGSGATGSAMEMGGTDQPAGGDGASDAGAPPTSGSGGTSGGSAIGGTANAGNSGAGGSGGRAGSGGNANGGNSGRAGNGGAPAGGGMPCPGEMEICDGIDNDCDNAIDEQLTCPMGCEGRMMDGHGYMFCLDQERAFTGANTLCAAEDMHLVWIDSAAENERILEVFDAANSGATFAWIGAADRVEDGEWGWVRQLNERGTPFWSGQSAEAGGMAVMGRYSNWGLGRPNTSEMVGNEDCASVNFDRLDLARGTWNDDVCSDLAAFICER